MGKHLITRTISLAVDEVATLHYQLIIKYSELYRSFECDILDLHTELILKS